MARRIGDAIHGTGRYLRGRRLKIALVACGAVFLVLSLTSLLAVAGTPGACRDGSESGGVDRQLAGAVDSRWHAFDDSTQEIGSVSFTEAELTELARAYVADSGVPVSDVVICLHEGYAEGSASVNLPLGLRIRTRLDAVVEFPGRHPKASIRNVRIGGLPGFFATPIGRLFDEAVERPLGRVDLENSYDGPIFEEGSLEIRRRSASPLPDASSYRRVTLALDPRTIGHVRPEAALPRTSALDPGTPPAL